MHMIALDDIALHYRDEGDPAGPAVVFANSLGTDLRVWDTLVPLLPSGLRLIRYDKRGHGLSDAPEGDYAMGALVRDAEALLDRLAVRECLFVGLSIGGMIAQGLAAKRPDLVRALVLSNSAARIGTRDMWSERAATVRERGIAALSEAVLERWFTAPFRETADLGLWRHMLERQPVQGYAGCCAAISGSDFMTTTSGLRLPALGIAGSEDGSTPPDLVRETTGLIPGSRFEVIRGAGHLPCVERPREYARLLAGFVEATGHARPGA